MPLKPRNDFCLIRVSQADKQGGVHIPGMSQEAQRYHVEAIGPKVEDLKIGDRVLCTGKKDLDFSFIPGHSGLMIIRADNVVLVFEPEPEEKADATPVPEDWSTR